MTLLPPLMTRGAGSRSVPERQSDDLVHAVGDEALQEHPDAHGGEVAGHRDAVPVVPGERRAEGDRRERPQEHGDDPDLEPQAQEHAPDVGHGPS